MNKRKRPNQWSTSCLAQGQNYSCALQRLLQAKCDVFLQFHGICNHLNLSSFEALWPLFHYLLWQDVTLEFSSSDADLKAYILANTAFSKALLWVYLPGNLIWVHSYHLLLIPKIFHQLVPDTYIGHFTHTLFPKYSDVYQVSDVVVQRCIHLYWQGMHRMQGDSWQHAWSKPGLFPGQLLGTVYHH